MSRTTQAGVRPRPVPTGSTPTIAVVHRVLLIASLTAATLAAGCTSDPAEDPAAREPGAPSDTSFAPEPAVHGPGTPLPDGLEVPDGAVLLLAPLPIDGSTWKGIDPDAHWSARLRPDDPVAAAAGVAAQADAAGFELRTFDPEGAACTVTPSGDWPGGLRVDERMPVDLEVDAVDCTLSGWRTVDGHLEELWVSFAQQRWPDGEVTATGGITMQRWPAEVDKAPLGDRLTVVAETGPAIAVDMSAPDEPAGALLSDSRGEQATLVEGSRLVAPVEGHVCLGGFSSVVEVTGDPDDVFEAYAAQVRAWVDGLGLRSEEDSTTLDGRTVREVHGWGDDSSDFAVVMVDGLDGGPPRILFELCGG